MDIRHNGTSAMYECSAEDMLHELLVSETKLSALTCDAFTCLVLETGVKLLLLRLDIRSRNLTFDNVQCLALETFPQSAFPSLHSATSHSSGRRGVIDMFLSYGEHQHAS